MPANIYDNNIKTIFVLGGTGFIGRYVIPALLKRGYHISALSRSKSNHSLPQEVQFIYGDPTTTGSWQQQLATTDAVINLAGANVAQLWTAKVKKQIYRSRIDVTRNIVNALAPKQVLVNMSAIGYYGFCKQDEWSTEDKPVGEGFLASICKDWEREAFAASSTNRVVILRMGLVLGYGGVLEQMAHKFSRLLGIRLGTGKQWFSWIHIEDAVNVILAAIDNENAWKGIYNACAPNPLRNEELMRHVGKILKTSVTVPIPSFVLKTAMGEVSTILLKGQRVSAEKLLKTGFTFKFPEIEAALLDLL